MPSSPNGSDGSGGLPGRRRRLWILLALLGGLISAGGGYGVRALQDLGHLEAEQRERIALERPAQAVPPDTFTPTTIAEVAGGHFGGPRAALTGRVAEVARQFDGDVEIRLQAGSRFVVLHIVPELPLEQPAQGQVVTAWGVVRFDRQQRWWELHPLLGWTPAAP